MVDKSFIDYRIERTTVVTFALTKFNNFVGKI